MKKNIALLAVGALIGLTTPAYAENVGDPMPEYETNKELDAVCVWETCGRKGLIAFMIDKKTKKIAYEARYSVCKDKLGDTPYAIYDHNSNKLFLDYDIDGELDEIIEEAGDKDFLFGFPECGERI